ncbi:hypothetical protein TNCV_194481 [Trichonephila clavipes]|nr:hypothetical protein TNCV_194481 [Trichonephila clavipes]
MVFFLPLHLPASKEELTSCLTRVAISEKNPKTIPHFNENSTARDSAYTYDAISIDLQWVTRDFMNSLQEQAAQGTLNVEWSCECVRKRSVRRTTQQHPYNGPERHIMLL